MQIGAGQEISLEKEVTPQQKQTDLSDEDVKKIARLARLNLEEKDLSEIKNDLNTIIGYFGQLDELDTENVEPMHHVLNVKNVWRDDKSSSKDKSKEIIDNGPLTENNYFKVPRILED